MKLLAIQPGHNATAGLMEGGVVTALLSQEKIDNIKNSMTFPGDAISAMLKERGLRPDQIDEVLISSNVIFPHHCLASGEAKQVTDDEESGLARLVKRARRHRYFGKKIQPVLKRIRKWQHARLHDAARSLLNARLAEIGLGDKPVRFYDHHLCHARAAYGALAPEASQGESLIFTLDGIGDDLSATVTLVGADGKWTRLAATPRTSSLGIIYSETTRFLGMKILEHEYKVMGLAAYCKGYHLATYKRIFEPVIALDPDDPLKFRSEMDTSDFFEYLRRNAVGERFDNIAGGLQHLLETRVVDWIRAAIAQTGVRNIYTGGGVFMNVKLNKCIQEMEEVERVSFLPSCGDESNPLGALYARAAELELPVKPLNDLYLGVSYSRDELRSFIDANTSPDEFDVAELIDIEAEIASLLSRRHVVARFSGRCEWGARSLGNRAILAHPSYFESFYIVNDLIKARDFWMPFAPSVLDSAAGSYVENYEPERAAAPYMITAFKASPEGVKSLRAAMHQGDFTIRPQVVVRSANPEYYRLLTEFQRLTGVGGVLNTSFNLHGYPLVATPEQAMMTLRNSGLEYLALGPFLISKKSAPQRAAGNASESLQPSLDTLEIA